MKKLLRFGMFFLSALVLLACATGRVPGPAVEFAPSVGPPIVTPDTVTQLTEGVVRATFHFEQAFPLPQPVVIDSLTAELSYTNLDAGCRGQDIAIALVVKSGGDTLAIFDVRKKADQSLPIVEQQSFPKGIEIRELRYLVYDDMCHPTNWRLALVAHRAK